MIHAFALSPPRHAFSPRRRARAGDVWRLFQEAAVMGSSASGWTPEAMHEAKIAFVVRTMTTVHHREIAFGQQVSGRTWVSTFERRLISNREIRLEDDEGPIAETTQEWVHLLHGKVHRAAPEVVASFQPLDEEPSVDLPPVALKVEGRAHSFDFRSWHAEMDPIGHANHPAYVDWCDEAISDVLHRAGLDPVDLVPVAERVRYKAGIVAPERVTVETRLSGRTAEGHVVCTHVLRGEKSGHAAQATTVRTLVGDGADALALALQ